MDKILHDRQINYLLHFTRADNLDNIFKYGLVPRSILTKNNIKSSFNDEYRYDCCEDAVCTSIEFPNYKMFYRLRCDNPGVDWAVLLLDAKIICDFECAFCSTNAGSSKMFNTPINNRKCKNEFLKLFDEIPNKPTRQTMGIKNKYPTDPQAEVLVFDIIPINYIKAVFFQNNNVLNNYKSLIPHNIKARVKCKAFNYRQDWSYWQNEE